MKRPLRILAIGGLDPSGRAGLLADLETIQSMGARAAAVATCLTVQGGAAFRLQPVSPAHVAAQLKAVLATGPVHAVKIGALPTRQIARAVFEGLATLQTPTVIDPVTRTSTGEQLSQLTAADFRRWGRAGAVLTPNWGEQRRLQLEPTALIVKSAQPAVDLVYVAGRRPVRLVGRPLKRNSSQHRGTGCRFASAVAVGLAQGRSLTGAARAAKAVVRKFLQRPILPHS